MNSLGHWKLTQHAANRANQRGILQETLSFVIEHSDVLLHAGEGRNSVRISKKRQAKLIAGGLPPSLVERAANVVLILDQCHGVVVTVVRDTGTKSGRKHRRQYPTWSKIRRIQQRLKIFESRLVQDLSVQHTQ